MGQPEPTQRNGVMQVRMLTDGSMVVERGDATVHLDTLGSALHVRTGTSRDALGGILLASYLLDSVQAVRLTRPSARLDAQWHGEVLLKNGESVSLGRASSRTEVEAFVQAIADQTGAQVEVFDPASMVMSLIMRGLSPTRYFCPAPGQFALTPDWAGVRKASGSFIRAIQLAVSVPTDFGWPDSMPQPADHYFVVAPGCFSMAPATPDRSPPRSSATHAPSESEDGAVRADPLARLREAVGPWREPTPPPRFPPERSLAPSSTVIRRPSITASDLNAVRIPDFSADEMPAPPPGEAEWAVSMYQAYSSGGPTEDRNEPDIEPELPAVRSLGDSADVGDAEDEEDSVFSVQIPPPLMRPRPPAPSARAPAPMTPPPSILEIPGFNDQPQTEEEPEPSPVLSSISWAVQVDAPSEEPVFMRMMLENRCVPPPPALVEALHQAGEDLPVATPEMALGNHPFEA